MMHLQLEQKIPQYVSAYLVWRGNSLLNELTTNKVIVLKDGAHPSSKLLLWSDKLFTSHGQWQLDPAREDIPHIVNCEDNSGE
jgi:hypothetical protein